MKVFFGWATPCIAVSVLSLSVFAEDVNYSTLGQDWSILVSELTRVANDAVAQEYRLRGNTGPESLNDLIDAFLDLSMGEYPIVSDAAVLPQGDVPAKDAYPFPGLQIEGSDLIQTVLNQTVLSLDDALARIAMEPASLLESTSKNSDLGSVINATYGTLEDGRKMAALLGCLSAGSDEVLGVAYESFQKSGVTMRGVLTNLTDIASQTVVPKITSMMNNLRTGPLSAAVNDVELAFQKAFQTMERNSVTGTNDGPPVLQQLLEDLAKPIESLTVHGDKSLREILPQIADESLALESSLATLADDSQFAFDQLLRHADTTNAIVSLASFRFIESMHVAVEKVLDQYIRFIHSIQFILHAIHEAAEFAIKIDARIHSLLKILFNNPLAKLLGHFNIFKGLFSNIAHVVGDAIITIIIHPTTPGGRAFRNLVEAAIDILRNILIFIHGEHKAFDLTVIQTSSAAMMATLQSNYPEYAPLITVGAKYVYRFMFYVLMKDPLILEIFEDPTQANTERAIRAILYALKKTFS